MDFYTKIGQAEVVITIDRHNKMTIVKNRNGFQGPIDFSKLLEIILPYQEEYLYSLILSWIDKLKIYRTFS
jgi:hypothetical protein